MSGGLVQRQMAALLLAHMKANDVTQAELARRVGRSAKHINQVFQGKAGSAELDYWAFVLGLEWHVELRPAAGLSQPEGEPT